MEHREQVLSGIAAIALAVLFPLYWIVNLSHSFGDFEASIQANLLTLNLNDLLFLLIGVLEVWIYLSLRRTLKDYTGTTSAQWLLLVMCGTVIAFHSTLVFDIYFAISTQVVDAFVLVATIISIGGLLVYSVTGIVFAALLLLKANEAPSLLKLFGVLLLITCGLQLTVVFSFVSILLFPAALVVLAIHFLKERTSIEVV